jgi:hypothetical protein
VQVAVAFCDPGWTDRSDVGGWRPVGNEGDDANIGVREHKGWRIALPMTPMVSKLPVPEGYGPSMALISVTFRAAIEAVKRVSYDIRTPGFPGVSAMSGGRFR